MKHLTLLLLFAASAMGQYKTVTTQCVICGRTLQYTERIEQNYIDNMPFSGDGYMIGGSGISIVIPDSASPHTVKWHGEVNNICFECDKKYGDYIRVRLQNVWDNWLEKAIAENISKRLEYNKIRSAEQIKALEQQIQDLKAQKEKLKDSK